MHINFQWMARYLFVSIHTIRPYWTDCIPVYRQVPVSPLQKRLYRRNMLQFHHQDWNQCPLFGDLKTCVNIFDNFYRKNVFQLRQRVDREFKIKFLTQEIHLYRMVFLNWIWNNKKSWLAKNFNILKVIFCFRSKE